MHEPTAVIALRPTVDDAQQAVDDQTGSKADATWGPSLLLSSAYADGLGAGFVHGARWQRRRLAKYLRAMVAATTAPPAATTAAVLELATELERD